MPVNHFTLTGVVADCEIRESASGKLFGTIYIDISKRNKEGLEVTTIPVKMFGGLIERVNQLPKGTEIIVWGKLSGWRSREGHSFAQIVADDYAVTGHIRVAPSLDQPPPVANPYLVADPSDDDLPF